jgi:iron complex outermembrane receptor protein
LVYDIASSACVAPGATNVPVSRPIASAGDALLSAPWAFTGAAEYHFPDWAGRLPYFRMDYQHQNAQRNLFPIQDANNALIDTTLRGPPVLNNLSLRAGVRFNGFDISAYANNVTNSNPLLFNARDLYPYAGAPGTGASELGPTTDTLYFGRGVRPRTIGVTATYRY